MRKLLTTAGCVLGLVMVTGRAAAQGSWADPDCEINKSHFLLNGAFLYLKQAANTRHPDEKEKDLRDAKRVLTQAIDQHQGDAPTAWYLFGRYYFYQRDLAGADSAWAKAEEGLPACRADIAQYRQRLWVPVLNEGVKAVQEGNDSAAKVAFYRANEVYRGDPTSYYYLANIYAKANQLDSAIANYRVAVRLAGDSVNAGKKSIQEIVGTATFNVAVLFQRQKQWDSAEAWFKKALDRDPNDPQALTGLATVYAASGKNAEARALYESMLSRADSLNPLDIFAAGVELFKASNFRRAEQAFQTGLKRNAFYRDALFNLTNTYLSIINGAKEQMDSLDAKMDSVRKALPRRARGARTPVDSSALTPLKARADSLQGAKKEAADSMLPTALRLVSVDPMNRASIRLLAAAYQSLGNDDSLLAALTRAHKLATEVTVLSFDATDKGAMAGGTVANLTQQAGQQPPIIFEFLDGAGGVVATDTIPAQQVDAMSAKQFDLAPKGQHIVAWRYKAGGS